MHDFYQALRGTLGKAILKVADEPREQDGRLAVRHRHVHSLSCEHRPKAPRAHGRTGAEDEETARSDPLRFCADGLEDIDELDARSSTYVGEPLVGRVAGDCRNFYFASLEPKERGTMIIVEPGPAA